MTPALIPVSRPSTPRPLVEPAIHPVGFTPPDDLVSEV
jgi:hypothetical protein